MHSQKDARASFGKIKFRQVCGDNSMHLDTRYRFRYAPSYRQSGSDRLADGPLIATIYLLFRGQDTRQVRLARVQKGSVALDRSRPFETVFTRADEDENDHDTEHFGCARILRKTVGML